MKWQSNDGKSQEISELQDNHLFYACRKIIAKEQNENGYGYNLQDRMRKAFTEMSEELKRREFLVPLNATESFEQMLVRVESHNLMKTLSREDEEFIDNLFDV